MNAERILQLADVIEKVPHVQLDEDAPRGELDSFNMDDWHCGTAGCIGGWAAQLFDCATSEAGVALGLRCIEAMSLFTPKPINPNDWSKITSLQAATVLRHLAATGIVDWSVATPVDGEVK
jgi:hypothetical protein